MCDCELSWLISDKSQWLPKVRGGECPNLAKTPTFEELDKAKFVPCSGIEHFNILTVNLKILKKNEILKVPS